MVYSSNNFKTSIMYIQIDTLVSYNIYQYNHDIPSLV